MLTEPLTSPATQKKQSWYAILVGILFPPQVHFLNFYSSPEIALVIGNLFSYIVSPKTKLFPIIKQKIKIAPDALDFVFNPGKKFAYDPGQYMEWTLDHERSDSRGVRRYFTLASSPTESDIRIGVKFYKNGSSYKRSLLNLDRLTPITATGLAGDFILPKDVSQKIAFIAGGIGVTPFRGMLKYLIDKEDSRSVVMLYSARNVHELAYSNLLEEARKKIDAKIFYYLTEPNAKKYGLFSRTELITKRAIQQDIPDYMERVFYLSGTHPMVTEMEKVLKELGVHTRNIKLDFFPGYT